ncbi:MAG: ribosome maturation factor RimP [Rhodospirillales bacterium]|nr:ribosome maturation factor RimP [Rhodospirillales bacterium]
MQKKHHLQDMLEPTINNLGFDLVRILTIGNVNPTLQIMIERKDRQNRVVDDCATVSRAISAVLDEKDPISGKYTLEVSSPGLDRPLVNLENFVRFAGFEAKVETDTEIEKRKRFKGRIVRVENDNIILLMDDKEWTIPFSAVAKAKLLLTDELIAAAQAEADEQEDFN